MAAPPRVIEAKDAQLLRVRDQAVVPLSSLYSSSPVVLVFFRRWGCQLCRGYAKKLSTELAPALQANGVRLSGVGLERLGVEDWADGRYFNPAELYVDEGQKAYAALGLTRLGVVGGLFNLLSSASRAWAGEVRAMGVTGNLKGDGMQLGATYVLSEQGEVWFEHRQAGFGDHPAVADIVAALQQRMPAFKAVAPAAKAEAADESKEGDSGYASPKSSQSSNRCTVSAEDVEAPC